MFQHICIINNTQLFSSLVCALAGASVDQPALGQPNGESPIVCEGDLTAGEIWLMWLQAAVDKSELNSLLEEMRIGV